eukprot:4211118-Pleurochrysis_carterae.AAC.1
MARHSRVEMPLRSPSVRIQSESPSPCLKCVTEPSNSCHNSTRADKARHGHACSKQRSTDKLGTGR